MSVVKTEKLSLILSQYAGISEEEASRFLSVFASVISAHVRNGEDVEVQGLGRFIVIDTKQSEMRRVALMLSEIMRDEVNSPFSFFEPYVINKGKEIQSEDLLNEEASSSIVVMEEESIEDSDSVNTSETDEDQLLDIGETLFVNKKEEVDTSDDVSEAEPTLSVSESSSNEPTEDEPIETKPTEPEEKNIRKSHKLVYFLISIVLILAAVIYYFNRSSVQEIEANEEISTIADSTLCEEIDTIANQVFMEKLLIDSLGAPVKIIATESDKLTSLSQRYFGSSEFWPYFYEVNKEVISSPSSELGGIELFVPNKSYYDIDASNQKSIGKAKALGIEIIKN